MAVIEPRSTRPVPLGAITTHRVVSLLDRALRGARDWWQSRATARTLAGLSDSELADIGLHRGNIGTAMKRGRPGT